MSSTHSDSDSEDLERLKEMLKALSGVVSKVDFFHLRNLDFLIGCRDSSNSQVRRIGVFLLSQYLLAQNQILEMVKEKKFLRVKQRIFLNNFDKFENGVREGSLRHILESRIPSVTSHKIVLMYFATIRNKEVVN
jgi:hypothetical protein